MPRVKLDLPEKFEFSTEIPIRISDMNYGNHLGNDAVLALLQEARVRYLLQHGVSELNIDGVGIIMVDAVVLYKAEAFYGDVLNIEIAVADLQTHGCDFIYRVTNKATGKEVVRAKTGIAFFNYENRKVAEVPGKFRSIVPSA